MEILESLNDRGRTIVLVTHETATAEFANRIIRVKDGTMESDTPVAKKDHHRTGPIKIIMLFRDAFKTATRSLTHGKMRSVLTMLGIVIGIASVIALMSIGQSAQDYILGRYRASVRTSCSSSPARRKRQALFARLCAGHRYHHFEQARRG